MRTGATNLVSCTSAHALLSQHFLKLRIAGLQKVLQWERVKMTSSSTAERRSPDCWRTSPVCRVMMLMVQCLWAGFVVVVAAAVAVQWMYVEDLRRRVSELEQTCQSTYVDKSSLSNDVQPSLSNSQHSTVKVGLSLMSVR